MRMKLLQDRVYMFSAAFGLFPVLNCGYRTAVNTAAAFITPALFPIWTAADDSDRIRRADISEPVLTDRQICQHICLKSKIVQKKVFVYS